jgi:hypothetical protein
MSSPDQILAGVYRDQWADYVTRFFPLENELVDTYNNPQVHSRIIGEATAKASNAFDSARGSYQRSLGRVGMAPDAQVQQETERAFGLGRTLAVVDAKNRTRQALVERDQGMLTGGMTTGAMKREVQ